MHIAHLAWFSFKEDLIKPYCWVCFFCFLQSIWNWFENSRKINGTSINASIVCQNWLISHIFKVPVNSRHFKCTFVRFCLRFEFNPVLIRSAKLPRKLVLCSTLFKQFQTREKCKISIFFAFAEPWFWYKFYTPKTSDVYFI